MDDERRVADVALKFVVLIHLLFLAPDVHIWGGTREEFWPSRRPGVLADYAYLCSGGHSKVLTAPLLWSALASTQGALLSTLRG